MDSVWLDAAIGALLLQTIVHIIFGQKVLRPMLKRGDLTKQEKPWRFVALLIATSVAGPGPLAVLVGGVAGLITWSFSTFVVTIVAALIVISVAASAWMIARIGRKYCQDRHRS